MRAAQVSVVRCVNWSMDFFIWFAFFFISSIISRQDSFCQYFFLFLTYLKQWPDTCIKLCMYTRSLLLLRFANYYSQIVRYCFIYNESQICNACMCMLCCYIRIVSIYSRKQKYKKDERRKDACMYYMLYVYTRYRCFSLLCSCKLVL
jgi:hypothetical protein